MTGGEATFLIPSSVREQSSTRKDSVSIVGLSFRVPQASDLTSLWDVLSTGREVVGPMPTVRFRCDVSDVEKLRASERPAAFLGAFLDDVERFDAKHFEISPLEARRMDPQQRLAMEEAWRALEDAGFDPRELRGTRTGVFVGSSNHDYVLSMSHDLNNADIFKIIGNALGMISNRISHFLDLRGPSFTLDTACSSGMVAIHTAMQSLVRGEIDTALCGGVNLITSPHLSVGFSRARMLSNDGKCKAFSRGADGYVRGEAVVFFTLMRTADAKREGRRSYGELLGSAVNQDGRTAVLTAPRLESQVDVMREALRDAGVTSAQLSYVEAHGTGTPVGDRVEYEALSRVLEDVQRATPCVVGTAKSYFGHAEPASGMVGLLKTIASLQHGEIPAHRHFTELSPDITAHAAIALPLQPTPWPRTNTPRIAGVSSFGFGGTNAHVILREPADTSETTSTLTHFGGQKFWKKDEKRAPAPAAVSLAQVQAELSRQLTDFLPKGEAPRFDAPLLELGVDSLDLFTLLQRVEARYGVRIPLERVLQPQASLATVAELIVSQEEARPARPKPAPTAHSMFAPRPLEGQEPASPRDADAIAAYTRETSGSKAHTERFRDVLADNRNVAGFRPNTKELTYPVVADRAKGSRLWDVDGHEWLDVSMGFGVHLFGHAPEFIHSAVAEALQRGAPLGPQSPLAGEVATLLKAMTGLDRFTFTNSGTEAVMLACRLARAATGREKVVIFEGAYHGTFDGLLGRRDDTGTAPLTPGIAPSLVSDLIVLPWGEPGALEFLERNADSLAAILVEPVQSRRPGVQPREFLQQLRAIATRAKAALIFDEIITGFRCELGGAQAHFGVRADLATYGKVVGGGFPIGVVGGTATFLDKVDGGAWKFGDSSAPSYELVFFAGTFCKHPLSMAAAKAVLTRLQGDGAALLARLNAQTRALCDELNAEFTARSLPLEAVCFGSLFRLQSQRNLDLFFAHLNGSHVYAWEGRTMFLSEAHSADDVATVKARVLAAAEQVFAGTAERFEVSAPQRRFLEIPPDSRAGHVGFAVRIEGPLERARFDHALNTVLARHEIFRAQFDRANATYTLGPKPRFEFAATRATEAELPERLRAMSMDLLDRGALARFELLELERESVFAVLTHGVLLDGYSLAVLVHELAAVYRGLTLPGGAAQYRDYLSAVKSRGSSSESGAFWQKLPPLTSSPPVQGRRCFRIKRVMGPVRVTGVTPFMHLFTAFSSAMAPRFVGDFGIAVPISDRRLADGDRIVGNLTQLVTVPQRHLDPATLLRENAALLPQCYEHAAHVGQPAPAQVLFNLEPVLHLPKLGDLKLSELDFPRPEAKFPLSVHVLESEAGYRIDFDALEAAFDVKTVEAIADDFVRLASTHD